MEEDEAEPYGFDDASDAPESSTPAVAAPCPVVDGGGAATSAPAPQWGQANPTATFVTSKGSFDVELYMDRAPRSVSNFIDLALSGFYDGLHVHRVVSASNQHALCTPARHKTAPCRDSGHARPPARQQPAAGGQLQ